MITVANRIYVNPDYAEQFEYNFQHRAGAVDQMPGFVSNQVLRPVNPGDPYIGRVHQRPCPLRHASERSV